MDNLIKKVCPHLLVVLELFVCHQRTTRKLPWRSAPPVSQAGPALTSARRVSPAVRLTFIYVFVAENQSKDRHTEQ